MLFAHFSARIRGSSLGELVERKITMAVEIINLCPEKTNIVATATLTQGQKGQLERAGAPFRIGASYILVPQVHHTQEYNIGGKSVKSNRFLLAEMHDGAVRNVRTISISKLLSWFWYGEEDNTEPAVKGSINSDGIWVTDKAKTRGKKRPVVKGKLPVIVDGNGIVREAVALHCDGCVLGYTPEYSDGKYLVKGDQLILKEECFPTFTVGHDVPPIETIQEAIRTGSKQFEPFLK